MAEQQTVPFTVFFNTLSSLLVPINVMLCNEWIYREDGQQKYVSLLSRKRVCLNIVNIFGLNPKLKSHGDWCKKRSCRILPFKSEKIAPSFV